MKKLTKEEQKDKAWGAYTVIENMAQEAYNAKVDTLSKTYCATIDTAREIYLSKLREIDKQIEEKL